MSRKNIITGYNNKPLKLKSSEKVDRLVKVEGSPPKAIVADDLDTKIAEKQGVADYGLENELEICERKSED